MLGIIFCGGQSSRMKSDKGLLMHNAKTWAEIAFEKLCGLQIPIKLSINEHQFKAYSKIFSEDLLIVDDNLIEVKGPLLGLLSVHKKNSDADLFILACDLLLMESILLKELLTQYENDKVSDAFIYTIDNQPEPLCGIYTSKGLKKIMTLQKSNMLLKHSMKYVLSQLNVCCLPIKNLDKKSFKNFNADKDLNDL